MALLSAPWQVACTITLRAKPRWSRKREELRLAGVAGGVFALRRERKLSARAEHMAMRVDAAGRKRKRGLLGPSNQSSQPLVFSNGPVTGLAASFTALALSRYI